MTTIEQLGPDDWRDFREIRMRALADSPTAFGITLAEVEDQPEAAWRERLAQGDPILAVRDDDRLVAMGAGWIPPETPDAMMVWGMWTAPEARGRGCAGLLLGRLVDHARECGVAVVELHVTEGNDTARRLYEQWDFVATGEWTPLREGSRLRIELMRRHLHPRRS